MVHYGVSIYVVDEAVARIIYICHTTCHTGSKIVTYGSENYSYAVGHVLATI